MNTQQIITRMKVIIAARNTSQVVPKLIEKTALPTPPKLKIYQLQVAKSPSYAQPQLPYPGFKVVTDE